MQQQQSEHSSRCIIISFYK